MPGRVLIIDTSVMCCLLDVPGKSTCGSGSNQMTQATVQAILSREKASVLVLPLATIIETGNHIAQASIKRFEVASAFSTYISLAADGASPWAAFTEQVDLWRSDNLRKLSQDWPLLAAQRTSIGDATIKDVAEFYARANYSVEILTGDAGLKAYQPIQPPMIPRRRR